MSQMGIYFLHSTSVLSFYKDVVLTLSAVVVNDAVYLTVVVICPWSPENICGTSGHH